MQTLFYKLKGYDMFLQRKNSRVTTISIKYCRTLLCNCYKINLNGYEIQYIVKVVIAERLQLFKRTLEINDKRQLIET